MRTVFLLLALLVPLSSAWAVSPAKVRRADAKTTQALALANKGDLWGAFQAVSLAVTLDPGNPSARLLRGVLLLQAAQGTDDPAQAADMARMGRNDLTEVIKIDPTSEAARTALGLLSQARGADLFAEPSATCSADAQRMLDEAEQLLEKKDYVSAESAYARATAACPENAVWWTWYGDLYFAQQRYARAGEMYQKALAIAPCYWSAHRFLADAQRKSGDEVAAYHSLTHAVVCNPSYEDAWNDLTTVATDHGASFVRPAFAQPDVTNEGGKVTLSVSPDAAAAGSEESAEQQAGLLYALALQGSQGATPLARRRDAVLAGLSYLGPARLGGTLQRPGMLAWQALSRAKDAGYLDEAILVLLVDAELVPELQALQVDHADRLQAFVERFVAPVPGM